jgi:hypothetical protein
MTGFDGGTSQIDQGLLDALLKAGIKESDARELASMDVFGGAPGGPWIAGLKAAANFMNSVCVQLDWGTLPAPWSNICPSMANSNGTGPADALLTSISTYDTSIQSALIGAIGAIATILATDATKPRHSDPTTATSQERTEAVEQLTGKMQPIDQKLFKVIRRILEQKGSKEQNRKFAGEQMLDWLWGNGRFIRSVYGVKYYLYRKTHKLYQLDTNTWYAWLYLLTGSNPASTDFRYFLADTTTAAEEGDHMEVIRVAHWDTEQQILRVSRFDGQVYRIDGMTMELEANGDGPVLFDDAMYWTPYEPDFSAVGSVLAWSTDELSHWDGNREELSLLCRCWWLASFFTELCPTRPILVMKGEKGSGKSMSIRILLRLLFGPVADLVGVPERSDAFVTLTSNSHIVAMDNMDTVIKEIRDKIASLSTGKTDQLRKLYTTNESQIIQYRCWLAVTSRTPDTLQRDDLADRLVVLPVTRIDDGDRARESRFLSDTMVKRNQWWGDTLTALNQIVAEIRRSGIPDRGGLRMEDWAALGAVISKTMDQQEVWGKALEQVKVRQAELLLEDDIVVTAIEAWLDSPNFFNGSYFTRNIYQECKSALYGPNRPDAGWPQTVKSFARRLAGMQRELQERLKKSGTRMSWRILHGNLIYEFQK